VVWFAGLRRIAPKMQGHIRQNGGGIPPYIEEEIGSPVSKIVLAISSSTCGAFAREYLQVRRFLIWRAYHFRLWAKRFSKHAGNGPEVSRTLSHDGPFLGCYLCNIAAGQLAKFNLELSRKASGKIVTLSALASRSISALAFSLSVQTWEAVNATKRAKMIPKGDSNPGEIALKERACSPTPKTIIAA
jgi:hypothetical protein